MTSFPAGPCSVPAGSPTSRTTNKLAFRRSGGSAVRSVEAGSVEASSKHEEATSQHDGLQVVPDARATLAAAAGFPSLYEMPASAIVTAGLLLVRQATPPALEPPANTRLSFFDLRDPMAAAPTTAWRRTPPAE